MQRSLEDVRAFIREHSFILNQMLWFPELDVGWYPIKENEIELYGDDYFEKFEHYKTTEQGKLINDFRVQFVADIWIGHVVDIGVGAGHFVESRPLTSGFDISNYGIDWLQQRGLFWDPYTDECDAITCWDSLEHIKDPWSLIERVRKYIFVTVPIARDCNDAIKFRHYKPREHFWYFTGQGLDACFGQMGFDRVCRSGYESLYGRQQVETFAFKRR